MLPCIRSALGSRLCPETHGSPSADFHHVPHRPPDIAQRPQTHSNMMHVSLWGKTAGVMGHGWGTYIYLLSRLLYGCMIYWLVTLYCIWHCLNWANIVVILKHLFIYLFHFWTLCLHFVISSTFQISQISLFQTVTFNEFVQNLVSELIQNLHLEYVFMWIFM